MEYEVVDPFAYDIIRMLPNQPFEIRPFHARELVRARLSRIARSSRSTHRALALSPVFITGNLPEIRHSDNTERSVTAAKISAGLRCQASVSRQGAERGSLRGLRPLLVIWAHSGSSPTITLAASHTSGWWRLWTRCRR